MPDLLLDGVAAGGVLLGRRRQALGGQAGGGGGDLVGGLDFEAEVVHAGGLAGAPSMRTSLSGGSAMAKLA
jgi:hypothetical protein